MLSTSSLGIPSLSNCVRWHRTSTLNCSLSFSKLSLAWSTCNLSLSICNCYLSVSGFSFLILIVSSCSNIPSLRSSHSDSAWNLRASMLNLHSLMLSDLNLKLSSLDICSDLRRDNDSNSDKMLFLPYFFFFYKDSWLSVLHLAFGTSFALQDLSEAFIPSSSASDIT